MYVLKETILGDDRSGLLLASAIKLGHNPIK